MHISNTKDVTIAGVAAQVIRVSGTQLTVITSGIQPTGCADQGAMPSGR